METVNDKVVQFKQRVATEWTGEGPAAAWQKHYEMMRQQFGVLTEHLIEVANPQPGMAVLDIASGTGEPALPIATRVAPSGTVVATDLSEDMLDVLMANARAQGISNVKAEVTDADDLHFDRGTFDLVTSRFGIMFVADAAKALQGVRRVLKPGGSAVFMVWGAPEPGSYFGTIALPYIKRVSEKPDPDGPGPMRFAEPGKLAALFELAAFHDVKESSVAIDAPYAGTPEELLKATFEIATPFRALAASMSDDDRAAAEQEAIDAMSSRYRDGFVNVTAPVLVVSGRA